MRSLLPKEHGAYAQLAAPLVTTFVAFGVTIASAILAVAACVAFVAHEPLLVLLGHRGRRAQETDGARASRHLKILVPLAAVTTVAGLVLAPPPTLAVAGVVAVPTIGFVVLAWKRVEKNLAGELLAACVLPAASAPIAVAAGASWQAAAWIAIGWAIGYASTVAAVHRVIARKKQPATSIDDVGAVAAALVALACGLVGAWAAVPLLAGTAGVLVVAPTAKYLRTIGFVMVGASAISLVLVVASS